MRWVAILGPREAKRSKTLPLPPVILGGLILVDWRWLIFLLAPTFKASPWLRELGTHLHVRDNDTW